VSLVLSLVISLTLTPMMCSRLLSRKPTTRGFTNCSSAPSRSARSLRRRTQHRTSPSVDYTHGDAGTIVLTGYLYVVIPKGFFRNKIQDDHWHYEASEDISFLPWLSGQQAAANIVLQDPAVRRRLVCRAGARQPAETAACLSP